jgi:hypothetical protein
MLSTQHSPLQLFKMIGYIVSYEFIYKYNIFYLGLFRPALANPHGEFEKTTTV